jgi:hypothetical protein
MATPSFSEIKNENKLKNTEFSVTLESNADKNAK